MNGLKHLLCLIAACVFAAPTASAERSLPQTSPIHARLVVPDGDRLLPGVPFDMWVELRNTSETNVGVGLCGDMLVTPENAEPFVITFGENRHRGYPTLLPKREWNGLAESYLVMRPQSTATLTLPILPELEGPVYLEDERLSGPGTYRLALRLHDCEGGELTGGAGAPAFVGVVTTEEAVVQRVQPSGVDASVWQLMQESARGKWQSTRWPPALAKEIIASYPQSNYYPYALIAAKFGAVRAQDRDRFIDAVKRFPDSPVVEYLHGYLWNWTSPPCLVSRNAADSASVLCKRSRDVIHNSKRPTTRIRFFGREDVGPPPCPPSMDCED